MPNYRDKIGLPVTTLTSFLEINSHISHRETILDSLEFTDREVESIRERLGILLLHICGATEHDIHQYVSGLRKNVT